MVVQCHPQEGGENTLTVIYADELFLENLVVDYALFLMTAKTTGTPLRRWRALLASALGGAYALAAALTGLEFLPGAAFKLTAGVLMAMLVFGGGERFLRLCLTYFALSAAFAGAVMAFVLLGGGALEPGCVSFRGLMASLALCWAVTALFFRGAARRHVSGELSELTVKLGARRVTFTALADTGNALEDPLSGQPVTVCSLEALSPLFDRDTVRILRDTPDPVEALPLLRGRSPAFRLMPYRSVGASEGLLLVFRPEELWRDGRRLKDGLIAVSVAGLVPGKGYAALTNAG